MSVSTINESKQSMGPRSISLGTRGAGFGFSLAGGAGLLGVGFKGVLALPLAAGDFNPDCFIVIAFLGLSERLR